MDYIFAKIRVRDRGMSKEILDLLDIQTSSKVSTLEKCGVETFAFLPVTGDLEKLVPAYQTTHPLH